MSISKKCLLALWIWQKLWHNRFDQLTVCHSCTRGQICLVSPATFNISVQITYQILDVTANYIKKCYYLKLYSFLLAAGSPEISFLLSLREGFYYASSGFGLWAKILLGAINIFFHVSAQHKRKYEQPTEHRRRQTVADQHKSCTKAPSSLEVEVIS